MGDCPERRPSQFLRINIPLGAQWTIPHFLTAPRLHGVVDNLDFRRLDARPAQFPGDVFGHGEIVARP